MKMVELGVFDAKTRLSELIREVEDKGRTFYVTKRGKRVAEIRPIAKEKQPLTKGCAKSDGYWMAPDFNETPEDFKDYV